jgi:nucleoside phosphorylase
MPDSYPQPGTFRIAIICALGKEANAVDKLFDKWWEPEELEFMQSNSAPKNFRVGCMKHHYVVLARCGKAGKVDAAVDAHAVRQTFPNIEIVLVAGICGGKRRRKDALGKEISISLGDIILGMEVLQYDVGKSLETGFDPKPAIKLDDSIHKFMEQLKSPIDFASLKGKARDHFKDTFSDSLETVPEANKIYDPGVHFGVVASGDMVIKSEKKRDSIKRSISDPGDDPIGFEMEASGVENVYRGRVIVIKSVCDYADKDKHKTYQEIAAMWSAAYTRAFLDKYQPGPRNLKQRVTEGMTEMRTKVSEVVNGETHLGEKVNGSLKEAVKTSKFKTRCKDTFYSG